MSEEKTWIYNLLSRPFRLRPLCCTAKLKSYEFKTKRRREEVKIPYFNFPWSKVASWGPKSHSPYKKNKNTNFVKYNRKGNNTIVNRNSTIGLLGQSPCFGISFLFSKKKSWRCGWDCFPWKRDNTKNFFSWPVSEYKDFFRKRILGNKQ